MNDVVDILEHAAPAPSTPLDLDTLHRRARAYRSRRRAFASIVSVVVVVAAALGAYGLVGHTRTSRVVTAGPRTTATTTVSASVRAALLAALDGVARANDGRVVRVEAVRSTHATAVRYLMGDGVPDEVPVWVVQAEGLFTCNTCSVPLGAKTPSGRVLTLIVGDPGLGGPLDLGISETPKDLSRLGPVVRLRG